LLQKRSLTLVSILQRLAAAEIASALHLRDFRRPAIFEFFNTIRHKPPVTILAQGYRDSPTSIVQLKSQYRTVRDLASEAPHQFRTRNNLIRTQRTRSKSNKNAAKSTKLIDILPLITVWLQVRVLPHISGNRPR